MNFFRRACVFIPYNEHNYMYNSTSCLYCTVPQEPGPGQNGKGEGRGCRDLPGTGSLGRKGCRCERHRGTSLIFIFHLLELITSNGKGAVVACEQQCMG